MLKIYSQMKTGRKKTGSVPLLGVSPLKHWPQDKPVPLHEGNANNYNVLLLLKTIFILLHIYIIT